MGRTRQQQTSDERQLVAIAAVLLTGYATEQATEAAVAEAMVGALPLAAATGSVELARLVAREVAELGIDAVFSRPDVGPALAEQAALQSALYRAAYLRAAAGRLVAALQSSPSTEDALAAWRAQEERYFALHLEAQARRFAGYAEVSELMDRHGPVLGWYATIRPTNRPHHRAAHRHNWRPLSGPPVQTGAYPGVLPFCLCEAGPPIPGAREIR